MTSSIEDIEKLFLTLVLFFCFYSGTVAQTYLKSASTKIVISSSPRDDEIKSAKLLNKWLNYIYKSDSGFQIVKENLVVNAEKKILITIGNCKINPVIKWDTSQPYSFRINRKGRIVSIQGATPLGTLIASMYFLDQTCGLRFYLPGDLFISEPNLKKINLDNIKLINETPFTKYVYSTGYMNYSLDNFKNIAENFWAQINGLQRKNWGSHQHSMGERFFTDSIVKLFPEIFPLVNGERYFPKSKSDQQWEPDFMEPKLIDAAIYSAIQYFKANPTIDYISFSVQDSYTYPTEGKMGDYLKKFPNTKDGKKQAYTNAFIKFLNEFATRLERELLLNGIRTNKTIVYLVYGNVSYIPLQKLNPKILPISVIPLAGILKNKLLADTGYLKKWSASTARIGNHDWAEGRGFIYPRIYTNLVSKYLRTVKSDGMKFEYAHIESYPNWSLDGPKYYFMSKIYWNPFVDTDSLLNLFCADMFGKANKQMQTYFKNLEILNTNMNNDTARRRNINGYPTQLPLNAYELSIVQNTRKVINKAYDIAETGLQKKRIELFSKGFRISEGFFDLYNSTVVDSNKVNDFKNYLMTEVAGNPMMLNIAADKDAVSKLNAIVDQVLKSRKKIVL